MEGLNLSPGSCRPKRKCEDCDAVLELLHGVSLSPQRKQLRQELGSTSHVNNVADAGPFSSRFSSTCTPDVELYGQLPNDLQLCPPDVDLPEQLSDPLPSPPVNDERAIVLYKPVSPRLFPGGPSAGSQIMLNARILSSGVLDASNYLRGRKEDELTWLQAPRSGTRIAKDLEVTEEEAKQMDSAHDNQAKQMDSAHDNRLAVVPWVSNPPGNMLVSQTAVTTASEGIDNMCYENLDAEAIEEDIEMSMDFVNSQPSNSSINFFYEPWQQFGAPQPQHSSKMWSH